MKSRSVIKLKWQWRISWAAMPRTALPDSTNRSAGVAIETAIEAEIAGVRAEAKAKIRAHQKTPKRTKNTQKMAEIVPKLLKIVKKHLFLAIFSYKRPLCG